MMIVKEHINNFERKGIKKTLRLGKYQELMDEIELPLRMNRSIYDRLWQPILKPHRDPNFRVLSPVANDQLVKLTAELLNNYFSK